MPFIIPALAAIGGGSALAGGVTALSAGAGIYSALKGNSAASQGAPQVGLDALNQQAQQIAQSNALASRSLEQQLTPEVPELRTKANQGIINGLTPDQGTTMSQNALLSSLTSGISAPTLQAAIAKANSDLSLGGRLGIDQQNLVSRSALASAGGIAGPGGGLGLGRDITARDLGLSSLGLEQQRLSAASALGGQEQGLSQANLQALLSRINALQTISQNQYGRQLAAGAYGQAIQQPQVGLDPGSLASISIGNQNAQSAANANQANLSGKNALGFLQLAGQFFGRGGASSAGSSLSV